MSKHSTPEDTMIESAQQRIKSNCPLLAGALPLLLRHSAHTFDAYFQSVCERATVGKSKTKLCCHYLQRDGNGHVRVKALAERLRNEIVNYSIPRSRIQDAMDEYRRTNSTVKFVALEHEAKGLFTELKNTGEGGELLLYVLTESILGYPQLLCKMPLKTSTHMHYHGVDGVHGSVDETTGCLALYWGESKLHKTVNGAVTECFKSIAPFLLSDGGSGARERRDMELLRDNVDLEDESLERAFRKYLDPDDPAHLKLQYRGVCLVGFDLDEYSDPCEVDDRTKISQAALDALSAWQKTVEGRVVAENLATVTIETFCIPFPSVEAFREAFLKEIGVLHES